jgi:PhoH-like ATPase
MYFYDTNALLDLSEKLLENEDKFYISSVSLHELEHIKTSKNKDEETRYKTRKLIRLLDNNPNKYETIIYNQQIKSMLLENYGLEETPDNQICACAALMAKGNDIIFVSNDLCCKTIAKKCFNLKVESSNKNKENIYTGYKTIKGSSEIINEVMSSMDLSEWNVNEYLIIENTDDNTSKEMRFDGEKFVTLKLPPSKFIKAKNSLQRCALDILLNPDITVAAILGGYGSGKTFLSMRMALYNVNEKGNQSKILGIREPRGEGKEVGFLPGSLDEKTDNFFLPLVQQLDGGEFELESLKQRGVLESNIPYYLKGTTYNDTIIIVDEAEDLDEKQIRLIGTRLGDNSKIYLAGDYKQSVINTSDNNALIKMCNEFKGNSKFGCIYLGEDVRSETSKMFADLFNK